jgi:hypothetical protein
MMDIEKENNFKCGFCCDTGFKLIYRENDDRICCCKRGEAVREAVFNVRQAQNRIETYASHIYQKLVDMLEQTKEEE